MGGKEDDNINSPLFMKFDWVEGVDRQGSSCKGMIEYFLFGFGLTWMEDNRAKLTALKINPVKGNVTSVTLKRNNEWNEAPKNAGGDGDVGHMLRY